ncbi:MAG TPA: AarF/UbiB family protein [Blastocatellia bacterium]|nr:AarF/UbiB family protein [Blastocatellia bacterium]
MARRSSCLLICAVLFLGQFELLSLNTRADISQATQQASHKPIPLPTPRSHYETYKPGTTGLPLLMDLLKEFDPSIQQILMRFAQASGLQDGSSTNELSSADLKKLQSLIEAAGLPKEPPISKEQAVSLIKQVNWAPVRPLVLEFFVHQSKVLDIIPPQWGAIWIPIVHDSLLYFLDHLDDDRLLNKLVSLAYLPPGTSRGDYLKEFVSKVPSLQKMGQILARNPDLAPDYAKALQDLENGIHTMTREELVEFITTDVGKPAIDKYQVEFADKILAEASVGAVIRATCITPGATTRTQAICKVVKPYVLVYLPEDLTILDGLAGYFTTNHDFYQLGSMPLVEIFQDIRKSLTNEIKIVDEQQNFIRAREYYKGSKKVVVPEIYPISTKHVTFMQFIAGEKIINAFPGDTKQRAIMARRLSDVMTGDVIFAPKDVAIFHGDPHAGNVYHVTGDPKNPYLIALLDWGLMGTFPRADRIALMQLILGVQLADAKRLHRYAGALLEHGMPTDPEKVKKIDVLITETVKPKAGRTSFEALQELLFGLIEQGYATKFTLNLFIKSQITIAGELVELDPTLKQDELLEQQVTSLVKKELPKRILLLPAWNYRGYRSLLSNGDVMSTMRHKPKPAKESKATPAKTASLLQPQLQH